MMRRNSDVVLGGCATILRSLSNLSCAGRLPSAVTSMPTKTAFSGKNLHFLKLTVMENSMHTWSTHRKALVRLPCGRRARAIINNDHGSVVGFLSPKLELHPHPFIVPFGLHFGVPDLLDVRHHSCERRVRIKCTHRCSQPMFLSVWDKECCFFSRWFRQ